MRNFDLVPWVYSLEEWRFHRVDTTPSESPSLPVIAALIRRWKDSCELLLFWLSQAWRHSGDLTASGQKWFSKARKCTWHRFNRQTVTDTKVYTDWSINEDITTIWEIDNSSYHKGRTQGDFVTCFDFIDAEITATVVNACFLPHAPPHVNYLQTAHVPVFGSAFNCLEVVTTIEYVRILQFTLVSGHRLATLSTKKYQLQ